MHNIFKKQIVKTLVGTILFLGLIQCGQTSIGMDSKNSNMTVNNENMDTATFGAGCFWCVEAIFLELKGVNSVISGYAGGDKVDPTYREVSSGLTGHAEVCRIVYDSSTISFRELLEVFWHVHDPTTLNQQGADVGTQYRSAVFYHNEEQKTLATEVFKEIDESDLWSNPLVTEIEPLYKFYNAEDYHQNYFAKNPNNSYCSIVVAPKVKKFREKYKDKLKGN